LPGGVWNTHIVARTHLHIHTHISQNLVVYYSLTAYIQADLAPLGLQLAQWGVDLSAAAADSSRGGDLEGRVGGLRWLDVPPAGRLQSAAELLKGMGAVNEKVCVCMNVSALFQTVRTRKLTEECFRKRRKRSRLVLISTN
jgi:hypothetical protein